MKRSFLKTAVFVLLFGLTAALLSLSLIHIYSEYDRDTLASEYFRDLERGLHTAKPEHYFPDNNELLPPLCTWRGHANLLYVNWLNFVYQETPFDLGALL